MNNLFGLRKYQADAVTEIEKDWLSGIKSICYQCPTGSGKTRILRTIIDNHRRSKKIIYVIAHRRNLVSQLSNELIEADIRHGIIASGYPRINYRVQVCSLQTLIRRIDKLPEAEIIIIDEAHHIKSNSYMKIISSWNNARILGVTATPRRLDGKPLSDVFQKLILGPTMRELINMNYLSDYIYYAPDEINLAGVHKRAGEYITDEIIDQVDNKYIIGSAVEHYKKYADHQPAIISCVNIAHAIHVEKQFLEAGYKAKAIHSKLDQKLISESITGLKNGSIEILTQCELLGEGIDIPGASVLIGLRPTASETIFLQHIGRVLRKSNNKDHAIIMDHVGNYTRHGLPDDERFWSLSGNEHKSDSVNYKRCPECLRPVAKHKMKCIYCGYIWETQERDPNIPEEKAGELKIIKGELGEGTKINVDWETLKEIIRKEARVFADAVRLAKFWGYTQKHAYVIWNKILWR